MACRVGITTDWQKRRRDWKRKHPSLKKWDVLRECDSKSEVQKWENWYANEKNCVAHPGGDGPEVATWYVYYFEY